MDELIVWFARAVAAVIGLIVIGGGAWLVWMYWAGRKGG